MRFKLIFEVHFQVLKVKYSRKLRELLRVNSWEIEYAFTELRQ